MFFAKETKSVINYKWKSYKRVSCNTKLKEILENIEHGHWIIQSHNYLHTIYCCSYCDRGTCSSKLRIEKSQNSKDFIILHSGVCNKTDHVKYPTGSIKNKHRRIHRVLYNQIKTQMFIACSPKHIYRYLEITYLKSPISYEELTTICKHIRNELKKGYNIFDVTDRCEFYNSNKISSKLEYENKIENKIKNVDMFTIPFVENDTFKNDDEDIRNCKIIVYTTSKLVERNLRNTLLKEEIFLTMDGTFQTIQCGRKSKKGEKLWVSISLGTVTLKWNSEKRIWINSYRPFLFAISESENSRATEALFLSFFKLSEWIGFDRGSYIVTGFTSDGALAFQNTARKYFPLVKVATCWPHISRKPFEKWAGKKNNIASHIHKSLCLLYASRSKEEFDAIYIYVKDYLKQFNNGANAIRKMRHSCEELEFRHSLLPIGYVSHTQCIERFNRSGNEMPVLKSDGKVFTNPICGGLYGLLRHAETNNCSAEFNDDILYVANNSHFDKNMLDDAKQIVANGDINIRIYYPEEGIREREYEVRKLWHTDFTKRQKKLNINNDIYDEYVKPECVNNLSTDDLYYNKRIIIDNKNYFEYKGPNRYYIGKIIGIIPIDSEVVGEMDLLSGIGAFLTYEKTRIKENVYCFTIECTLDGENYDKYGTYCIKLPHMRKSFLGSLSSKRILKKIKLKSDDIKNLSSTELLQTIKSAYDSSQKKSIGKKRILEDLYEKDLEYYAVNSIDNLNKPIDEVRILDVINSKRGLIKVQINKENSENTLDKIKEKSFGIHTVIYDNINNHLTCDCATYHKTAFCCSHIYAVRNYVIKDLDIPI